MVACLKEESFGVNKTSGWKKKKTETKTSSGQLLAPDTVQNIKYACHRLTDTGGTSKDGAIKPESYVLTLLKRKTGVGSGL